MNTIFKKLNKITPTRMRSPAQYLTVDHSAWGDMGNPLLLGSGGDGEWQPPRAPQWGNCCCFLFSQWGCTGSEGSWRLPGCRGCTDGGPQCPECSRNWEETHRMTRLATRNSSLLIHPTLSQVLLPTSKHSHIFFFFSGIFFHILK